MVFTDKEKKKINYLLTLFLFFLPLCSTVGHVLYIGVTLRLNVCMGREEQFFYDFQNIFVSSVGALYSRYFGYIFRSLFKQIVQLGLS